MKNVSIYRNMKTKGEILKKGLFTGFYWWRYQI